MPATARALFTTRQRQDIRDQLQKLVEQHLPPTGDIDITTERNSILKNMDPVFKQEAAMVLLDEAIHGLLLSANHRRRSVFENRVTRSAKKFKEATDAFIAGDNDAIGAWQQRYIVDSDRTMRTVAEMTRKDLVFVAEGYDKRASREALRATFFRRIAAQLPDDNTMVQDVMDEAQYATEFRSVFIAGGEVAN